MKNKKNTTDMLFVLGLFLTMFIAMVSIVVIGANVYSKVAKNMDDNFSLSTAVSYIAEKSRQSDEYSSIHISEIEGVEALVLIENDMYTYIYFYEGYLREIFTVEELEPTLYSGQKIVAATDFKISQKDESFLISIYNNEDLKEIIITPVSEKEGTYE
ncbi:MAG: DUF4860 domain-containing protein [Lachnospiraceae bacterium]